jgi:hypothetical protein
MTSKTNPYIPSDYTIKVSPTQKFVINMCRKLKKKCRSADGEEQDSMAKFVTTDAAGAEACTPLGYDLDSVY